MALASSFFLGSPRCKIRQHQNFAPTQGLYMAYKLVTIFLKKILVIPNGYLLGIMRKTKQKMTVGFLKSETCNSMGISFFDKPMALRALITLDKHASINTKRVATRLYIYCSVHSRGCKLLPIELIIFNC